MYSVVNYMYRDASNYKNYGSVTVEGMFTEKMKERLRGALSEGTYFIPEQVELERPMFDDGFTEDDHCWCELDPKYDIEETEAEPEDIHGTAEELVQAFEKASKEGWKDVAWAETHPEIF